MTGDPEQFVWFLSWVPFALGHGLNPLLTNWVDYPQGVNLMWNTSVPLPALLMAPLTVTAGPVLAYNVMATVGLALTAWSGELAAARLVTHRGVAVVGGLLTGFSPFMTAHALGHPQLFIAFLPGLAFVLLDDLFIRRRRRWWAAGGLLGLASAAQLLTGEEILASTLLAAILGAALWAAGRAFAGERMFHVLHWRHAALGLATAALVGLLLTAGPLAVQLFGPQRTLHRAPGQITGNDLAGFVVPTTLQALHPFAVPVEGIFAEQNNYIGLPLLLALAAIAWLLRRDRRVPWLSALAAVLALLSLGPHLFVAGQLKPGVLPWRAVSGIPVLNDVLPNRLMMLVYLLAGSMLAMALDRAISAGRALPVTAAVAIGLVPLLPAPSFPATLETSPAYFAGAIRKDVPAGAVVLVAPMSRPDAMLWQAQSGLWFHMPEGYVRVPGCDGIDSNYPPPSATSRALSGKEPADVAAVREELAYWRVTEVILGPGASGDGPVIEAATGDPGRSSGGVLVFHVKPGPVPLRPPPTLCRS